MPSERSAKSASVVPTVVVATLTNQHRGAHLRRDRCDEERREDRGADQIAEVQRHRHGVAGGLAERRRRDLDDPEAQRRLRHLAESGLHASGVALRPARWSSRSRLYTRTHRLCADSDLAPTDGDCVLCTLRTPGFTDRTCSTDHRYGPAWAAIR